MGINRKSLFEASPWSTWVILPLLFLWTLAQPIAVIDLIPIDTRISLFFWKNVLGVILIGISLFVLLINLTKGYTPPINKTLFSISLVFPVYSLFTMLFRNGGTSIEEQILYFLWPLALYIVFPALFSTHEQQRKGIWVILSANLLALGIAIFPYIRQENFARWTDYQYRVSFGFTQPNIFSASWAVLFGASLYLLIDQQQTGRKIILRSLSILAITMIFFARSESTLILCIGAFVTYHVLESSINRQIWIGLGWIIAALLLPLVAINLNPARLHTLTSGRIQIWQRTWELNMEDVRITNYLAGRAHLLAGNPHYTGERMGFQAARAQMDNAYLARFLQSGLVGFLLYFLPLLLMLRLMFRRYKLSSGHTRRLHAWAFGSWIGVFLAMWALDIIPSFGNVLNIFLFVASAVILTVPKATNSIDAPQIS